MSGTLLCFIDTQFNTIQYKFQELFVKEWETNSNMKIIFQWLQCQRGFSTNIIYRITLYVFGLTQNTLQNGCQKEGGTRC